MRAGKPLASGHLVRSHERAVRSPTFAYQPTELVAAGVLGTQVVYPVAAICDQLGVGDGLNMPVDELAVDKAACMPLLARQIQS